MTNEELQRAYQRHAYQRGAGQATIGSHPDPEQLADLVRGTGTESSRIALLEHVMRCYTCRPELDLLRAASEGARAANTPRVSMRWMVLAAAAVLVIGVSALTIRGTRSNASPDIYRGQRPAMALLQPAAGAAVAQPVHLTWHALEGARNYRVELLSARGDVIAAWSTSDTALAIPDTVRLDASESYDVWVRATLADRTEVSSPIVRFSVK